MILSVADAYALCRRHGATGPLARIMVAGMTRESGRDTQAVGDQGHSIGLFQLHDEGMGAGLTVAQREDPDIQMRVMGPIYAQMYSLWAEKIDDPEALAGTVCCYAEKPYDYENPYSAAAVGYRAAWRSLPDPEAPVDDLPARVMAEGAKLTGIPYRLDPPPDGVQTLDCSLFIQVAARNAGVAWPAGVRTVEQIRGYCAQFGSAPLAWSEVQLGDLLFFTGTYADPEPSLAGDGQVATHVGFSYGAGTERMLDCHAANGDSGPPGVGQTDLRGAYWQAHLYEARRPWWAQEDDMSELNDLRSLVGYLTHDCADALEAALDGIEHATTADEEDAALDAARAVLNTLREKGNG